MLRILPLVRNDKSSFLVSDVTLCVIEGTMATFRVRDDVYGPPEPRGSPTRGERGEEEWRRVVRTHSVRDRQ